MPYVRKRRSTARKARVYRKRRGMRGRRAMARGRFTHKNVAKITEEFDYNALGVGNTGSNGLVYGATGDVITTGLNMFPRASAVAASFQEYRITKVRAKFIPFYNMYQDISGAGTPGFASPAVPQIIAKVVDTLYPLSATGSSTTYAVTKQDLLSLDGRIKAFTRQNNFTWRPKVIENVSLASPLAPTGVESLASRVISTPWLVTNQNAMNPQTIASGQSFLPSQVQHWGLAWYIDQSPTTTTPVGRIIWECDFEFRKPLALNATAPIPSGVVVKTD